MIRPIEDRSREVFISVGRLERLPAKKAVDGDP
jgi:hypothetical protein